MNKLKFIRLVLDYARRGTMFADFLTDSFMNELEFVRRVAADGKCVPELCFDRVGLIFSAAENTAESIAFRNAVADLREAFKTNAVVYIVFGFCSAAAENNDRFADRKRINFGNVAGA